MNDLHDLELLLRSRVPLITVKTRDERRVARLFSRLGIRLGQPAWRKSRHPRRSQRLMNPGATSRIGGTDGRGWAFTCSSIRVPV